jgi:hypothetical protein
MIRMLVIGYSFGIRSERRLCDEVHLNLAYRWFCRLGLNEPVPDHSTFSKNRHGRFRQSDLFRRIFEVVLQRCMLEGLVGGEGFAIDASVIKADANRERFVPAAQAQKLAEGNGASRAVREHLDALEANNPAGPLGDSDEAPIGDSTPRLRTSPPRIPGPAGRRSEAGRRSTLIRRTT